MDIRTFTQTLNAWGSEKIPFLFFVDFEMTNPVAIRADALSHKDILFDINGFSNVPRHTISQERITAPFLQRFPISFEAYQEKFDIVYRHLQYGDSYLTNLTVKTPLKLAHSLQTLYHLCEAKYKLFYRDQFLVFSPETFIQIKEGKIFSFPMKGTIDATLPGAFEKILHDQKELAEHVTIVDLIRNDLSQVATNVRVKRFRYIEEIKTNHKHLLQVSSEIEGDLAQNYTATLGSILVQLLPAGSVSGAPKPKTMDIISLSEGEKRGYYTGVFGYFDGSTLDSGVMIRFIEKQGDQYFYRSGGGITTQSTAEAEYQEVIDKVYVPLN